MLLKKFQMASIEISTSILNISWGISVTVVFYYVFFWNCEHIGPYEKQFLVTTMIKIHIFDSIIRN